MEQKLRQLLGDCMFTIANLQDQVEQRSHECEQLQKRIKELEDESKRTKTD